jgi:DNA-binding GntR family transcriptional regulator
VREPENLVEQLVERIQEKIGSGEYVPGQKLRQAALAKTFQVSRTPVRQALTQLAARGLVDDNVASGFVVRSTSPKEVRDVYRVRAEVEGLAAELAAQWITDRDLMYLRTIHQRFIGAVLSLNDSARGEVAAVSYDTVRKDWIATNSDFHAAINRASCNEYVQRIVRELNMGSTRALVAASALGMYRHRMERNIDHHEAILKALEARNPVSSRAAMCAHVLESGEFVAAWLENQKRD